ALNQITNSPRLPNSSPVLGNAQLQPETISRPTSSRMRQNSNSNSTSNLQHSLLPEKEVSRPASAADNKSVNGSTNGLVEPVAPSIASSKEAKESVEEVEEDTMDVDKAEGTGQKHRPEPLKNEDVTMEDVSTDVRPRRGSITSTPRTEAFPDVGVSRTRGRHLHNGRSRGSNTPDHSTSAQDRKSRGRRKSGSGAHILKQIASFNRSPDAGRRRDESKDSEISEDDGHGRSSRRSQPPRVTTVSRNRRDRGNGSRGTTTSRRTEASQEADDEPAEVEMEGEGEEAGQVADEDEGEEGEDGDEPKYCYCGQGSFGEMIACDNDDCPMEWFHLGCTGLRAVPGDNVKWFCDVCKEPKGKKAKMMAARH
ncbi:hypothetical protein KCU64_g20561, partial [Aureobasidium melanogenum]